MLTTQLTTAEFNTKLFCMVKFLLSFPFEIHIEAQSPNSDWIKKEDKMWF